MHARLACWTLTTLVFAACGDGKNDTESATDGATTGTTGAATDSTIGVSSAPTTGDAGTDGTAEGTAEGTAGTATSVDPNPTDVTEGGLTSDVTTTTEPGETTGGVDPGIMAECMALCVQAVECKLMGDVATCTAECSEGLGGSMGLCKEATSAFLECAAGLDCEQLTALFIDEDAGPCTEQQQELATQCQTDDCVGSIGSNREGTECSLSSECDGQPILEMQCDTETCTCLSDNKPGATCPAEGICMTTELLGDKAAACCGF